MKIGLFKLLLLLPFLAACQTISPRLVCHLPDVIRETSGLIALSPNIFWTMNDSGGENKLYQFDSTGHIHRVLILNGATNKDWEELATDASGNFYVGDIGNNSEKRTNLIVYKVLKSDVLATANDSVSTVNVTLMPYNYADQSEFPPPPARQYFDAEAMLVYNDTISIFSKDFDTDPYIGSTHIYGMRNQSGIGQQAAARVDTFATDNSWKYRGAITAAAVSPDRSKVILMSYQKLWIFTNFVGKAFWKGQKRELSFGINDFVQREAVAFVDNCTVYITSEKNTVSGVTLGGNLSTLNICDFLPTSTQDVAAFTPKITAFPTPSVSDVFLELSDSFSEDLKVKIYNINGIEIFQSIIKAGEKRITVNSEYFTMAGFYIVKLLSKQNLPIHMHKIFIVR